MNFIGPLLKYSFNSYWDYDKIVEFFKLLYHTQDNICVHSECRNNYWSIAIKSEEQIAWQLDGL